MLERGLRDERDLSDLLEWLDGPIVGRSVVCGRDGLDGKAAHVPPFRFLADVVLGRVVNYLVWANRSGSKSYLQALATWILSASTPRLETTILGGSLEQSAKAYAAMDKFWSASGIQDELLFAEPTKRLTLWRNRSAVAILAASQKSTRGPHPQRLVLDEIDEMKPEIYESALSQPTEKEGLAAGLGQLSTHHRVKGVMTDALERAAAGRTPVYKWCIWECLEPCLDYNCSTCPISSLCPGKAMKSASGYFTIRAFADKLTQVSMQTLRVEWNCEDVMTEDLVYGASYSRDRIAPLGTPGFSDALPVYLSIDWGGTHPFSVGVWQRFEELGAWVRVDEVYKGNTTNQRLIEACRAKPWWKRIAGIVADPSRPDLIGEWWTATHIGFADVDTDRKSGVEAVRNAMAPIIGNPAFLVNPLTCPDWLKEIEAYENDDRGEPVKVGDHAMDETRYFVKWKIGAQRVGTVSGMKPKKVEPSAAVKPATLAIAEQKKEDDNGGRKPFDRNFGGRISTGSGR